ncbi:hypothetical protein GGI07_004685 [Coemansia sp. Benny D115]|nr:hypothetical protein GGI07_004685 [Coemansia sp. Benny D115]
METSPTDNPEANKATPLGRSRRASIASMLMRRSSRSIENNINLANEPEVKALEDKIELDFDTAKQNKAQDPILDDSVAVATDVNDPVNIEPEALVPDQQTPKDTTTPVESPAEDPVEPATDTQPTATSPATPAAVIATASVTNNEPAPVDSTPFDSNPVDSTSGIQESSSESSLQESTTDSHTKISNVHKDQPTVNEQETTLFPESIDEIEPPMDDGLSRRSSRIFLGLSRKVQNVRQSASMALKRSMGSRLSVTVPSGTHTFESSVPLEEQNQESANVSLDTPVDIPVDIPVDTPVESNVQTLEPTGDTDVLENDISEDSSMKPEVEVTGTNRGLNVKRRLTLVKRGTNEAVRNGVSRVKSIFTSKRPPVTA